MVDLNQNKVDELFNLKFNGCHLDYPEDCDIIVLAIKHQFNIDISTAEAAAFWMWRSDQYDAGWLTIAEDKHTANKEITQWFEKYFNEFWKEEE